MSQKESSSSRDLSPGDRAVTSGKPETCSACFKPLVVEAVQILRGQRYTPEAKWVESSVKRCADCKHTFGGTLEDRLAYIRTVYGYKYFGDYEPSEDQLDAIWEAKALAELVPDLLEAVKELLGMAELFVPAKLDAPGFNRARAAIAKAQPLPTPAEDAA